MPRTADGGRRWAAAIVAVVLCGSPLVAILLNQSLAAWSFLSFELRNLLLVLVVPLVFGLVSETRPLFVNQFEARDGVLVFAAIILIGWFFMLLKGWAFGFWTNFIPLAFFLSQVGAFLAGRWLGRIPRRKLPQETADS